MNKNKNIVIIAARGNSKRLPNKNVMHLQGKPLIAYSIEYAKKHNFIDEIYVSTDCKNINQVANEYGAIVIDRPAEISGDHEPTITAMQHVLKSINTTEIDTVILLQPTNPLRPKEMLKEAYDIFKKNNFNSLFTVTRNHHKLGKIKNNHFKPYNYEIGQRSQDLEPLFYENGLLYITQTKLILEGTIISNNAFPLEIKHIFSTVDIDTLDDMNHAKYILQNYPNE